MHRLSLFMVSCALLGCRDGTGDDPGLDGGSGWWPLEGEALSWWSCSLYEGADDGLSLCAAPERPLFWDDTSDTRTMQVWTKQLPAPGEVQVQLWLLDGGPGGSGLHDHPARMEWIQSWFPGAELYTIDHRGTGYTERLGCSVEDSGSQSGSSISTDELPDCIAELVDERGDRLDATTTTFSALDVAAAIVAQRREGVPVYVWGGSYGSYWAQRLLQVAPALVDGVIVEGLLAPDATLIVTEANIDLAARRLFARCGEDEVCRAHLGEDPWAFLEDLFDRMDAGHWNQRGITRQVVGTVFAYAMYSRTGLGALPAAAWRMDRCQAEDVDALIQMYTQLFGDGGTWDIEAYSPLLQHHITYGELWQHPDFEGVDLQAYFDEVYDSARITKGYGYLKANLAELWPAYTDLAFDDGWPETDTG